MANHAETTTSHSDQQNVGQDSEEEKRKRLETENGLLRGKIRGFATLADMFRESKDRNRMFEKQNALLIQIVSLLIPTMSAEGDETAAFLPEEMETIFEMDNRPNEDNLKLLTSITSKLNTRPKGAETLTHDEMDILDTSQKSREENRRRSGEIQTQTPEQSQPPSYQLLSRIETATESETPGPPSTASFSIIQSNSGASNNQHHDEFAEFKQKFHITPHLLASDKVKSVSDFFELVLRGCHEDTAVLEGVSQICDEVFRAVVQLEIENRALNVVKVNACQEFKNLRERDRPVVMGTSQGHHIECSWVDLSSDVKDVMGITPQEFEKLKEESDHKDHVITKLKGHINELTKANVAWDRKYSTMKKEFSTKILILKKKTSTKPDPEISEFVLIGPEEVVVEDEKVKFGELEAKLRSKETAIAKLEVENKKLKKSKDLSPKVKENETEIHLLRQQVRIFKDDFATERNEHKKLWKKNEKVTENYQECKKRMQDALHKVAGLQKQLLNEKREKETLQLCLSKSHYGHQYHHPPSQYPEPLPTTENNGIWKCQYCTFDNVFERTICEMCGKTGVFKAPDHHSPQSRAQLMSRERKDMTDVRPPPIVDVLNTKKI